MYTQKLIDKCKSYQLNLQELLFCDLINADYNESDAYLIAYKPLQTSQKFIREQIKIVLEGEQVKNYLEQKKEERQRERDKIRKEVRQQLKEEQREREEQKSEQITDVLLQRGKSIDIEAFRGRDIKEVERELNYLIDNERDTKIKADLLKLLHSVVLKKREEEQITEKRVLYYMPLTT